MKSIKITLLLLLAIALNGCGFEGFQQEAGKKFGDQHFKTAISLIELHKIREGNYPETLQHLKYLGDWDMMIFGSLQYKKLDEGYELNLIDPFSGAKIKEEGLKYPGDFWNGLGLKSSNMKPK